MNDLKESAINFLNTPNLEKHIENVINKIVSELLPDKHSETETDKAVNQYMASLGLVDLAPTNYKHPNKKILENTIQSFLFDMDELPYWLINVLESVCRQQTDNTLISPKLCLVLLKQLPIIDTDIIKLFLNRMRILNNEEPISDRYARSIISTLRNIIDAVDYHSVNAPDEGPYEWQPITLGMTIEQRLKYAGLSTEEIERYKQKSKSVAIADVNE